MKIFFFCFISIQLIFISGIAQKNVFIDPNRLTVRQTEHPRLLLTDSILFNLKNLYNTDKTLHKYVNEVLLSATKLLTFPSMDFSMMSKKSNSFIKEYISRLYLFSFAFRWTGEERFAIRAKAEMLEACNLKDWNTKNFIDVAEMTHATAIGYDWLYSNLDSISLNIVRSAIINKGLEPGRIAYMDPINNNGWWAKSDGKWNLVCNSGLIIGSLSILETNPEYAKIILPSAIKSLPRAIKTLGTTGGGSDGYASWYVSTFQLASALSALQTATGSMAELETVENLENTGLFPIFTSGTTNLMLCFGDQGERVHRMSAPVMFWLARNYNKPELSNNEHLFLLDHTATVSHIIWYIPLTNTNVFPFENSKLFIGPTPILTMRSSWNNPNSWFVGVKAGKNTINSGHLDLGNFELDHEGLRWIRDLGSEDFELPDYFNRLNQEKRLTYFRVSTMSHNVPVINNCNQEKNVTSNFIKWKTDTVSPFGIVNLSEPYCSYTKKMLRGIKLITDKGVLLQDEYTVNDSCDITCGFTTDALVYIKDNKTAVLRLKGKELYVHLLKPKAAVFYVNLETQTLPEKENLGVSRLNIRLPKSNHNETIAVLFSKELIPFITDNSIIDLMKW